MKKALWILLTILMIALCAVAQGDEAQDITKQCRITRDGKSYSSTKLRDRKYSTYAPLNRKHGLVIDGKGKNISGVFVQFYDRSTALEIQVQQPSGEWETIASGGEYLSQWFPLPAETGKVRLYNASKDRAFFSELTVYGEGDKPARVPEWRTLEKADLLLLVGHPDDELLWFGGLLPTYAGERGLDVQVVYAVRSTPLRRLELLDGLWTCGVTAYPDFLNMPDVRAKSLTQMYKRWSRNNLYARLTEKLRKYKPDVAVTQDYKGEYGHAAHRAVADALTNCYQKAADPEQYPSSAKAYGTWAIKKLYVHLDKTAQIRLDWHIPLNAFDGEDSMSIAKRAMACHASQTSHGWKIEEGGKTDNTLFGLVYSAVGPDEAGNDLMEHVQGAAVEETEEAAEE